MPRKKFTRADLNEKQAAFVDDYLARGGTRHGATEAVMAVYGYDKETATSAAYRMLKNEKIRDVIVDESIAEFPALAAEAVDVIRTVMTEGQFHGQTVKPNVGVKAAFDILERGLGAVAKQHEHTVNHEIGSMTRKELEGALVRELKKLRPADREVISNAAGIDLDKVIDVEVIDEDRARPGPKPQIADRRPRAEDTLAAIKRRKLQEKQDAE